MQLDRTQYGGQTGIIDDYNVFYCANDQRYYISNEKLRDVGWDITVDSNDGLAELVSAC